MTLPTFLEQLFVTEHDDIDPWIRQFNTHKGAGRLVQIWSKKLRLGKRDEDFVNNAVDVVVKRIGMALKDSKVRQGWRLPHKEVTEQKIADFLVDDSNFLLRYADKAKYLTRLLKGLLPEDGPDQSLLNKARKRHSVRRPSSIRGCIMAILIFISSQKVNAFQTIMGLFLHSTGCPKRVLRMLSGLGLSISYSQVQNVLRSYLSLSYILN